MNRIIRNHHGWLAGLTLCCSLGAQAAPLSIAQLMGNLAQHPQGAANFTEKKFIAILDEPVESSGELLFIAPARLEKRTLKPKPESMVLDGDTLTLQRGTRKRTLQLRDYPEVAGMIESIRATLAGDRLALERVYQLALSGNTERWTLALTPRDVTVSAIVALIEMSGAKNEVKRIEIFQADGDRSVMQIQKTAAPEDPAQKNPVQKESAQKAAAP